MTRNCGSRGNMCSLCCRLLPMSAQMRERSAQLAMLLLPPDEAFKAILDFDKPAGQRCPHQRYGKGCAVHERKPIGCRLWSCRWLAEADTAAMARPDRAGYVIDVDLDYVRGEGSGQAYPVLQIWCDPDRRDAYKDPALVAYLKRRHAKDGLCALVRFNADSDCLFLYVDQAGELREKRSNLRGERPHTAFEKAAVLGGIQIELEK